MRLCDGSFWSVSEVPVIGAVLADVFVKTLVGRLRKRGLDVFVSQSCI